MSSRPWMKWFAANYIADTLDLSDDADLLYRRLLEALWIYGPLPHDERQLARVCRIHLRKFRRSFAEVLPKLCVSNGTIDHKEIIRQRKELADLSQKRAAAGRKGGQAIASPSRARDSDSDTDKDPKKTPSGQKKGSRLPADWTLPDEWRRWAGAHLSEKCVQQEADKFRDYWIAVPGAKGCKLNWQSTWRNWVRRAAENCDPTNGARGHAVPVWKLTDSELVDLANERGIPTKGKTRQELIGDLR